MFYITNIIRKKKFNNKFFNRKLAEFCLKIIHSFSKNNLRLCHLISWNILCSKNTYKKYIDMQGLKKMMVDLMNNW